MFIKKKYICLKFNRSYLFKSEVFLCKSVATKLPRDSKSNDRTITVKKESF